MSPSLDTSMQNIQREYSEVLQKAAIDYVNRGYYIMPVNPADKNPYHEIIRKVHQAKSYKQLETKRATVADVQRWYEIDPMCNIGILLEPMNLVALDFDTMTFPYVPMTTPTARTGRGIHMIFKRSLPAESITNRLKAFDIGIPGDIKLHGYIQAPPSIHPETKRPYQWIHDLATTSLTDFQEFIDYASTVSDFKASNYTHASGSTQSSVSSLSNLGEMGVTCPIDVTCPDTAKQGFEKSSRLDFGLGRIDTAEKVLRLCGVRGKIGLQHAFCCPLHPEKNPSAWLMRTPDGSILMNDAHWQKRGGVKQFLTIGEVYYVHRTGQQDLLLVDIVEDGAGNKKECRKRVEKLLWWLRALTEAKEIQAPRILHEKLPDDAPGLARDLYRGFVEALGLRTFYDETQTTAPYSCRFASRWTGHKNHQRCAEAIKWLCEHEYLECVSRGSFKDLRSAEYRLSKPSPKKG